MTRPAHPYIVLATLLGRRQDGQTAAEYGVVLGVIMLGIVATIGLVSGGIDSYFTAVAGKIGEIAP